MIRQRSIGWAIHLGPNDFDGNRHRQAGLFSNGQNTQLFRTRAAARRQLSELKPLESWPWPRARVVKVDIRVETRG